MFEKMLSILGPLIAFDIHRVVKTGVVTIVSSPLSYL